MDVKLDSKEFKDMVKRVKDNVVITNSDYSTRPPTDNEAKMGALTCLRNNLLPEEGHITFLFGKDYITWAGTKHALDSRNIYWAVTLMEYWEDPSYKDLICNVKITYIIPKEKTENIMDTYYSYIKKMADIGIDSNCLKDLMPSITGVGTYKSAERQKATTSKMKAISPQSMAKKRAIMNALSYSGILLGRVDDGDAWLNYLDNSNSNTTPSNNTSNNKNITEFYDKLYTKCSNALYNKDFKQLKNDHKKNIKTWVKTLEHLNDTSINKIIKVLSKLYKVISSADDETIQTVKNLLQDGTFGGHYKTVYEIDNPEIIEKILEFVENPK